MFLQGPQIRFLKTNEFCFPIVVAFPGFSAQFSVCLNPEEKEIGALASELPCILMQDLAFSTIKKYFGVFQKLGGLGKTEKSFSDSSPTIFFNLFFLSQIKKETSFSTFSAITSAVASWTLSLANFVLLYK